MTGGVQRVGVGGAGVADAAYEQREGVSGRHGDGYGLRY